MINSFLRQLRRVRFDEVLQIVCFLPNCILLIMKEYMVVQSTRVTSGDVTRASTTHNCAEDNSLKACLHDGKP